MSCYRTRFYKVPFQKRFLLADGTGPYTRVGRQSAQGVAASFIQVTLSALVFRIRDSFYPTLSLCGQSSSSPALEAPPIPADLFGQRDGPGDATIGCFDFSGNAEGIAAVNVYRGTASGGPYSLVGSFNPNTDTQIFDAGLDPDTDYFYVLRSLGDGITYLAEESGNSAEITAYRFSAPTAEDWTLEIQDEGIFITGLEAGIPDPSINNVKVRFRIAPATEWILDDIVPGEFDEVGTIQPGQTVEAQIAWGVIIMDPASNTQASDWSESKFETAP